LLHDFRDFFQLDGKFLSAFTKCEIFTQQKSHFQPEIRQIPSAFHSVSLAETHWKSHNKNIQINDKEKKKISATFFLRGWMQKESREKTVRTKGK
jgi:hypothetical protein